MDEVAYRPGVVPKHVRSAFTSRRTQAKGLSAIAALSVGPLRFFSAAGVSPYSAHQERKSRDTFLNPDPRRITSSRLVTTVSPSSCLRRIAVHSRAYRSHVIFRDAA